MGTSYPFYKQDVRKWICDTFNRNIKILDVGCGCGTYYNLLHDEFPNIDGVEVFKPNITAHGLLDKYKNLFNCNITDFRYDRYDLIIFGDIIEHLDVKEAQTVLDYAYCRCTDMIVALPYMYEQDEIYGNVYEIHKQPDLTKENVLERYPYLELLIGDDLYGYYIKKRN